MDFWFIISVAFIVAAIIATAITIPAFVQDWKADRPNYIGSYVWLWIQTAFIILVIYGIGWAIIAALFTVTSYLGNL